MGSENFDLCTDHDHPQVVEEGTRKEVLRAEIDTSQPFGSVKEAVSRFGGRGSWLPYYKFHDGYQALEDIDIKKVEEQAAELEKDLIVKELETLDVLEELAMTKEIVEELKLQLQNQALIKCLRTHKQSPKTSPNLIMMELKQAKLNLGKTIDDLGVIKTSVECLNKKMKKEKLFLAKTRQRLTSNFAGVLSLGEELKHGGHVDGNLGIEYKNDQIRDIAEVEIAQVSRDMSYIGVIKENVRAAELRLVAAKQMQEAARAAEAVALAEIKLLSSNERPKIENVASFKPLILRGHEADGVLKQKKAEANISKMSILQKLKEAREEVKLSKQALEEALKKVEMANRKQFATEEALRKWKWVPEEGDDQQIQDAYYLAGITNFHPKDHPRNSLLNEAMRFSNPVIDDPNPVMRSTNSKRDVLNRKQALPEEHIAARPTEDRQKVALSQMLHELREDLTLHPQVEKAGCGGGDGASGNRKQLFGQRRRFGFIHIALPMTKTSKKKVQDFKHATN